MDRIVVAQLTFITLVILANFIAAAFFFTNPAKFNKDQKIPLLYFMLLFLSNGICFIIFTLNIFSISPASVFINNTTSVLALFALRHGLMWRSNSTKIHLHKLPIFYISIAVIAFLNLFVFYYLNDNRIVRTIILLCSNMAILFAAIPYVAKIPGQSTFSEKVTKVVIYTVLFEFMLLLLSLWMVNDPFVYLSLLALLLVVTILLFLGSLLNLLLSDSIALHYQESMTDPLTNLYNRRFFMQQAAVLVKSFQRYKSPTSLIICDIDNFKKINDKFGHSVGDNVIIEFAKKLQSTVRETDILARFGGEEFVIMMPQTSESNALLLAERMRSEVEKVEVFKGKDKANCTASFGVTSFKESEGIETKLKHADLALYSAKANGRNKVKLYENDLALNP
mgnify:FL=1